MTCTWGQYEDRKQTCPETCFPCGRAPTYWSANWFSAVLHLLNGVITFALYMDSDERDNVYKLTETSAPWIPRVNGTCAGDLVPIAPDWCMDSVVSSTSELSLWWLVIWFHLLSFVFQCFAMFGWERKCGKCTCSRDYRLDVEEDGTNLLRMVEYSISATLMQISIALVLGVWERLAIIGIAFLTTVCMLCGLIAEQLRTTNLAMAWTAHFTGWIAMIGVWTVLGRQFMYTVSQSVNDPPEFVFAIVIGIAVLYLGFGFVQTVQLALGHTDKHNQNIELAYCVMSIVSKTFLGWMIFANALSGMSQN